MSSKISAPKVKTSGHTYEEITVTDARGRVILYREPTLLDKARIARAIGRAGEGSDMYSIYAHVAACVRSIDNFPCVFPTNAAEVDMAIDELGDEGLEAIDAEMRKRFLTATPKTVEDHKAEVGE